MNKYKVIAATSLGCGLLFGVLSFVFFIGDWQRFAFVFCMGLFVGLIAAPEFEPKIFKNPALFQLVSGAIAGALAGAAIQLNSEAIILGVLVGGLLGWFAPSWLKHIQIP